MANDPQTRWDYTVDARRKFGATYKGRHLIGRDTVICGGVDFGRFRSCAIVVDPVDYPETFERLYSQAERMATKNGRVQRDEVLDAVFETVRSNLRYCIDQTYAIAGDVIGQKVALNDFIEAGVGTCREMALTSGALLEMFRERGHIRGAISIDRNEQWNPRSAKFDGHQWVRYTSFAGRVYILDVAQNVAGELSDTGKSEWNYARPEERMAMQHRWHRGNDERSGPARAMG